MFCGETIIPKGLRGSQLSFKFTIRIYFVVILNMRTDVKYITDLLIIRVILPVRCFFGEGPLFRCSVQNSPVASADNFGSPMIWFLLKTLAWRLKKL